MKIVAWANVAVGLLVIALSIPLWMEKLPRNGWYGVRMPKSQESDEAWYKINCFGGQAGVATGLAIPLLGLTSYSH